ncbi:MAG: iron ABC transporter permease [Gemmatimonadaceae bacterium]|nr:iron ABC transporter permease [Gemmatimonadaceae bacterium]
MRAGSLVGLIVVLVVAALASVSFGAVAIAPADVWAALRGEGAAATLTIVRDLRLPRTALGILVGAALGASGTAMQSSLRNGLAEPYLLGVSGGAAVGAVLAVGLGVQGTGGLAAFAFLGALAAIVVVLGLGRDRYGARHPATLLMAGVVTGAFANAVIMVVLAQSTPTAQRNALWWMMGSIAAARWADVAWLGAAVVGLGGCLVHYARELDVLALGPETAASLGVTPERAAVRFFVLASLLAAATVAASGLVGFVGLIVPHVARGLVGVGSSRRTIVVAAAAGGALVLVADLAARTARAPTELPLGAITALLGVPFFLRQLRSAR